MRKKNKISGFAVASLILGVIGFFVLFVPSVLAIVSGIIALKKNKKSGKKLAIAGIVLGMLGIILALIITLFMGGMMFTYFGSEQTIKKALASGDVDLCDRISNKMFNQKCYQEVAVKTKDAGICEKMIEETWRNSCFRQLAIEREDESLCREISIDNWEKHTCFLVIAEEKQDKIICEKIDDEYYKDYCLEELDKKSIEDKVEVTIKVIDSKLRRLLPWVQVTIYDSEDNEIFSREQGKESMFHIIRTEPYYLEPGFYVVKTVDIDEDPEYDNEELEIEVIEGRENEFEIIMVNPEFEGLCIGENDHWGFETMQWKSRPVCFKGSFDADKDCWKSGDCEGRCIFDISDLSMEEYSKINEGNYKPGKPGKCSLLIDNRCTGDYVLNEQGIVEFTCIE